MSGERLSQAAKKIRRDLCYGGSADEFYGAIADWLEVTERDVGTSSLAYHAAVAVADTYLGGGS